MKTLNEKTIGQQLAAGRQAKGWTLEEAAKRTKLKKDSLVLMESDEFDRLPSVAYARGFIRLYARELGLDGWGMLKQFNRVARESLDMLELQPEDLEAIPKRSSQPVATPQGIGLVVIVLVLLVALGFGGTWAYRQYISSPLLTHEKKQQVHEVEAPAATAKEDQKKALPAVKAEPITPRAETVAPNPAEPAKAEPVTPPAPVADKPPVPKPVVYPNRLELQADADAREEARWVRVTAIRAGKEETLFEDILPAGDIMPKPDQTPWTADAFVINMREAAVVNIIYNGQNYGKYDQPGLQRVRVPSQ
ncbi:MAG: helix-turn-helix domain-containing protein [Methylacidiphilales bacterium]|nr:helix-turn-helix domain-containing protein [Candidatus Methylacidiphilales bacterium]